MALLPHVCAVDLPAVICCTVRIDLFIFDGPEQPSHEAGTPESAFHAPNVGVACSSPMVSFFYHILAVCPTPVCPEMVAFFDFHRRKTSSSCDALD